MKTKHTPIPWKSVQSHADKYMNLIGTPHSTPGMIDKYIGEAVRDADADHIVRCVNSHDELVAALEWIMSHVNRKALGTVKTEHGIGTIVDAHLVLLKINAALAKVTGGSNETE